MRLNMEEEERNRIIKKIIREQDLISIYAYDACHPLLVMQKYSDNLYYSDISKFIMDNPTIIDNFSIKNLYTILVSMGNDQKGEEVKKRIHERIAEKVENEDFFCENLERDFLSIVVHTAMLWGSIEENLRDEIRKKNKTIFNGVKRNRI